MTKEMRTMIVVVALVGGGAMLLLLSHGSRPTPGAPDAGQPMSPAVAASSPAGPPSVLTNDAGAHLEIRHAQILPRPAEETVPSNNLVQTPVPPPTPTAGIELPKNSWTNAGLATPEATLMTRGWAVLNGDREQFAHSIFMTDGARKLIEDQLVQMAAASKDPDAPRLLRQALAEKWGAEEAILMPMMALNQNNPYTGYRILSQQVPAADETAMVVETEMAGTSATTETLRFRRFNGDWKIVIDEDVVRNQMR